MEYKTFILTGMVVLLTMYLYGALDKVRNKLMSVIDYGFIKPQLYISRTISHILAYIVFATPIVYTFIISYDEPWYYWKTNIVITMMAVAFAFSVISTSLLITRVVFNNKTVMLNWIAFGGVLYLYIVYAIAPTF